MLSLFFSISLTFYIPLTHLPNALFSWSEKLVLKCFCISREFHTLLHLTLIHKNVLLKWSKLDSQFVFSVLTMMFLPSYPSTCRMTRNPILALLRVFDVHMSNSISSTTNKVGIQNQPCTQCIAFSLT